MDNSELDPYRDVANHMISNRTCDSTKHSYKSKLSTMLSFFKSNPSYESCIDENGEMKIPLTQAQLLALFGWISTNPELSKGKHKKKKLN